jgi:hypothetical protein
MGRHHPGTRRSRNPIPISLDLGSRTLQPARIQSDAALTGRLEVPQPAPRPTQPSARDGIEAEGRAMTREELAAILDRRGRISAARSGRAGKRLVISLAPLSETEAADFLASVPGSRVRPSRSTGRVEVDVKGAAALTFVESVVDLLGDGRRARLSSVLDILDAAHAASTGNTASHV